MTAVCPGFKLRKGFRESLFFQVGSGRQKEGLVLDPTDGLHLVGVSLGAVLVVVSVLALVSVSLQDVLVATVTRELVGHPAAWREGGSQGHIKEYNISSKQTFRPVPNRFYISTV